MTSDVFGPGFSSLPETQRLQRAAQELEAVVLNQLLSTMRSSITESDVFGKEPGHDVFRSMLDGEMARETAKKSPFGLADAIVARFEKAVKAASESVENTDGPAATPSLSPQPGPELPPSRSWRI